MVQARRVLAWSAYLVYIALIVAAGLLLSEYVLRRQEARSAIYPISAGAFRDHPYYGHELTPGFRGTIDPHGRLPVPVRPFATDSLGLRTADATAQPLSPARTILVLGDSQVFGYWQSEDETIPAVVSRHAPQGQAWTVLNGGVSGYGTINQFWLAKRVLAARRVDRVVLVYYTGNDLENNASNHLLGADPSGRLSGRTDYDVLRARFRASPDTAFKALVSADLDRQIAQRDAKSWKHRLIWWLEYDLRSRLFARAVKWYGGTLESRSAGPADTPRADPGAEIRSFRYARTGTPEYERLWRFQAAALDELIRLTREHGIPLQVAVLPQYSEVLPEYLRAAAAPEYFEGFHLDKLADDVCRFTAGRGVACATLAPALRSHPNPAGLYWAPTDQHLTPEGSRVVGRRLAELATVLP